MLEYYGGDEYDLVEYVDHMGDDEAVCDAARVSMDKKADIYSVAQNAKLIDYLARCNHWSPFSHCTVKMRFKAPIFIARQLMKHQVGFSWNEVSRRYVSTKPYFWLPWELRMKAENVKQGSSQTVHPDNESMKLDIAHLTENAYEVYDTLVKAGVCPEQARMVLPQNMMTEWIWTGSLYAWSRMYHLRADPHAQFECQIYAKLVSKVCDKLYPMSWRALREAK